MFLKRLFSSLAGRWGQKPASAESTPQSGKEQILVFDLDCLLVDTRPLYPHMERNIALYLSEHLSMSYYTAKSHILDLLRAYKGYVHHPLKSLYNIEYDTTLRTAYNPAMIKTGRVNLCPATRAFLDQNKSRKFVLTNAWTGYASALLKHFDIQNKFQKIYGLEGPHYYQKPCPKGARYFMQDQGFTPETHDIWFFEDTTDNLEMAKSLGWRTVFVKEYAEPKQIEIAEASQAVDHIVETLSDVQNLPSFQKASQLTKENPSICQQTRGFAVKPT